MILSLIALGTVALAFASLLIFQEFGLADQGLQAGNVAPQEIQAPFGITYESKVLTDRQRENAANAVPPVYTPTDTQIARQQAEKLRATLSFISSVRADQFATQEEKLADISLIADGALSPETELGLLTMSSEMWQVVQQETVLVLEQVQRSSIRPTQVADTIRSVPALISLSLPDEQTGIVAELVSIFVAPNSFYSEELTDLKRQQAAEAVAPVQRTFIAGEVIVQRGRVLTDADIEALRSFGLLEPGNNQLVLVKAILTAALAAAVAMIFLYRQPDLWEGYRQVFFNAAVFLLFLFLARFLVLGQAVIPFIYPVAAYGLLLTSLFGMLPGLILPISLSFLITFGMANQGELTLYYAFSTIFAVLLLGGSQRIISFFWAGIGASAAGAALVAAFRLLEPQTDLTGLATLMAAALIYGLASAGLAILLQFVAAKWLRKTTNLQLVELSRPEHPLLRLILLKAPGTYQHSLQVANLAEQAAERVEADPLLTRVGAMYHDAGKTTHPQYFIENQIPGTPNLHDSLSAQESAEIIIRHVTDGVELAHKHRLPKPIIDFILEHHGTNVTRYQYVRAVNEAGGDKSNVDIEAYTYPGPRPQSKETALVMLADGCEARARAERPPTEFALRKMIKETIDARIADNQLDDVPFTPRDLNVIQDVFTSTLKGVYHPRLEYPKIDQRTVPVKSRASGSDSLITEPTRPEILGETGNDD